MAGKSVWTENMEGERAYADDGLVGLDKLDDSDDRITQRGVIWIGDCGRCGWQLKATITWGEVLAFHMRQAIIPNTKMEPWGVLFALHCRNSACGKNNAVRLTWFEIQKYLNHAIQARIIDPNILAGRPQQQGVPPRR